MMWNQNQILVKSWVNSMASDNQRLYSRNWFGQSGKKGLLRMKYRPRTRIFSFFFGFVPWLNVMLLLVAFLYISQSKSVVSGERVYLPKVATHTGMSDGVVVVARPLYTYEKYEDAIKQEAEDEVSVDVSDELSFVHKISVVVFYKDERFNLSREHRSSAFYNALKRDVDDKKCSKVLLYMDEHCTHGVSMELLELFRGAGINEVCFVEKDVRE